MNASHDENHVPTIIALEQTDGATIVNIKVDPVTHRLASSNGTGGTDYGPSRALHDDNRVPTMVGVSSADGVTPIAVYGDLDGNLLINTQ